MDFINLDELDTGPAPRREPEPFVDPGKVTTVPNPFGASASVEAKPAAPKAEADPYISLDDLDAQTGWRDPIIPPESTGVADYGRAAISGAYGLVGSTAAGLDYLTNAEPGGKLDDIRRWAREGVKGQTEAMSPGARDTLNAGFLPGGEGKSIWDHDVSVANAIGLNVMNAAPSLLSSIIPAGIVGNIAKGTLGRAGAVAAGTATSGAISGLQTGGGVYEEIEAGIVAAKEDELRQGSPLYSYLRDEGYSDTVARKVLAEAAAGNKPLLAGLVGAAAEQLGAGRLAAQAGAGIAERGVMKGLRKGAVSEGATEAGQSASEEAFVQAGGIEAGTQKGYDVRKIVDNSIKGGVVGAALGGAVGGVSGATGVNDAQAKTAATPNEDLANNVAAPPPVAAPRAEARTALNDLDAAIDQSAQNVQAARVGRPTAPDSAEASVIGASPAPIVTPELPGGQQSETPVFTPKDDYEEEADFEPGQPPVALPVQQEAPRITEVAPGQPPAPSPVLAPPVELPATVAPSTATETPSAIPAPQVEPLTDTQRRLSQEPGATSAGLVEAEPPPSPVVGEISLDDVPTDAPPAVASKPRVLKAVEPKVARTERLSKAEAKRIAAGEGDAVTLSHNPDDWDKNDRSSVYKLVDAHNEHAKKNNTEVPEWVKLVNDARGKMAGAHPAARAAQAQYQQARQMLSDEVLEKTQSDAVRRETAQDARNRKIAEKRTGDALQMKAILDEASMSNTARNGNTKAIKEYAELITKAAKKFKIVAPQGTDDPYLIYLREAAEVAAGNVTRERAIEFVANDHFIRNNAGEELAARRRSQAVRGGTVNEERTANLRPETETTDADTAEQYDAVGEIAPEEQVAAETEADERSIRDEIENDVVLLENNNTQANVRTNEGGSKADRDEAVVAGADKAGTFKTEKRRKVVIPGKGVTPVARRATSTDPSPTPAQKEAGNYSKRHLSYQGLDISIENEKGSTRSGKAPNGRAWSVKMPAAYGYIRGTEGFDGDQVDVYLGPDLDDPRYKAIGRVWVINQRDLDGKFDEHKVMIGWNDQTLAKSAYANGFSDGQGYQRIGLITPMSMKQFKEWLAAGGGKKSTIKRPVAAKDAPITSLDDMVDFFDSTADEEADPSDGVTRITSPTSTKSVRPIDTRPLGDLLGRVKHDLAGGPSAKINPIIAARLKKLVADVPVHLVSTADMRTLAAGAAGVGGLPAQFNGYYDPNTRAIVLDANVVSNASDAELSHLLIHEGMHAAVMDVIDQNPHALLLVEDAMRQVRDAVGIDVSNPRSPLYQYGMVNANEFMSELFSSVQFQEFLSKIPARDTYSALPLKNVWSLMLDRIRKWLRLPGGTTSMLEASLRVGTTIVDLATDQSMPSTPRTASQRGVSPLGNAAARAALDGSLDVRNAAYGRIRTFAHRFSTFDQLERTYRNVFPNGLGGSHLTSIWHALQRQQKFIADTREEGEKIAEWFADLQRQSPDVARRASEVAEDATMANLNLLTGTPSEASMKAANPHIYGTGKKSDKSSAWQSKARHAGVQAAFSKLPIEVQKRLIAAAGYYRRTQSEISERLVDNIFDLYGSDMDPVQAAEIKRKTLAGTLSDDDAAVVNNKTFFNMLKAARELKAMKGMYFPLMRHGDYIVRTTDRVKDTMGGRELSPGLIEFRGKEKDARAKADRFARNTGLVVTRVSKRYFDPATGEPIKGIDADANSTVAYQVSVQTEGFYAFDTRTQAENFRRRMDESGQYHGVSAVQVKENIEQNGDLNHTQLSALVNSIRQRDDIPDDQKAMVKILIGQAAVRLMSGNRIQSRSLPRTKVQGASQDFPRNALAYATSSANYLGKLRYMPGIRDDLTAMGKVAKDRFADKDGSIQAVYAEVLSRINNVDVGINEPSRPMKLFMQVVMLSKLASPAYSIINAMGPMMTSYPVLAGDHGSAGAVLELTKAFNESGAFPAYGIGLRNTGRALAQWRRMGLETNDVVGAMRKRFNKSQDGAAIGRLIDALADHNIMNDKAQFEMAASIATGAGPTGKFVAKLDRAFRQLPTAVEAVNRVTTAVAAFRLAKKKGMREADALQYAMDTVLKTQGDYSPVNAAPVFNNPIARPFLQFKKYSQFMTHMLGGLFYNAVKGETREHKIIALKQLGQFIAVQTLVAGALSIPGLELAKVGFMVAAMLGLSEGWEDQERKIKRLADQHFGESWSELVRKGVVSRAIGIDLSSRMSLADMWTGMGEPEKYTGKGVTAWVAEQAMGASGGTLAGYMDGVRALGEGKFSDAAEKIVPIKAATDSIKAIRGLSRGDYNPLEATAKAAGFRTAREANYQDRRGERIRDDQKAKEKRNKLRREYIEARTLGDRLKVRSRVIEYNKSVDRRYKLSTTSMDKMREEDLKERARP